MCKHYKVIAIIFDKRGRVISVGENSYTKTHPIQRYYADKVGMQVKVFLHAEIDAIIKARKQIKDAYRIFVCRYNSKGKPVCAKPCPICQKAIADTPIKVIEHT